MAKFDAEQTIAVTAITQLIYEWGNELDINNGVKIADSDILTPDCRYNVAGVWRESAEQIQTHYRDRMDRLKADAPVMRHIISNIRVSFSSVNKADAEYRLVFFASPGKPPIAGYCDPLAVADVRMEFQRAQDGHWRISLFDSNQVFQRG